MVSKILSPNPSNSKYATIFNEDSLGRPKGGITILGEGARPPLPDSVEPTSVATAAIPPEQPPATIPASSSSTPLTYGEWVTSQREQIEANRKQAVIDAQSSYMKNLSTYGANKDRLASSGLTNSGYGEYLTSRAYTQMRDDVQAANKLATDANLTLSAQELEHNEALKTKYAQYLTDIANGTYSDANTAEKVGAALGLTTEQTNTGKNMVTDQKVSDYYNAISAGTLNTSEVDKIKDTIDPTVYADLQAKWNESWKIDDNTFIGSDGKLISYKDAKAMVDEICNNSWASEPTKKALTAVLEKNYSDEFLAEKAQPYINAAKQFLSASIKNENYDDDYKDKLVTGAITKFTSKIVDVRSSGYESSKWGNFVDIDDPDSKQGKYLAAIIADEKAGRIRKGAAVKINYGSDGKGEGTYVYVGDGIFIPYTGFSQFTSDNLYLPAGYKQKNNGNIKEE